MATSKSLKTAVKTETKEAEQKASHGNVKTEAAPVDLASGARRGHPQGDDRPAHEPYVSGPNEGAVLREQATGDWPTGARSHPELPR